MTPPCYVSPVFSCARHSFISPSAAFGVAFLVYDCVGRSWRFYWFAEPGGRLQDVLFSHSVPFSTWHDYSPPANLRGMTDETEETEFWINSGAWDFLSSSFLDLGLLHKHRTGCENIRKANRDCT